MKRRKRIIKGNIIVSFFIIILLSFMTIGYANYEKILETSTNLSLKPQNKVEIINVELVNSLNVTTDSIPIFTKDSINLNLVFKKQTDTSDQPFMATYSISIQNNTYYNYNFIDLPIEFTITDKNGKQLNKETIDIELSGIETGDIIKSGETVTFSITITFVPEDNGKGTYTLNGDIKTEIEEKPLGTLLGALSKETTGNLKGENELAHFKINIINSHETSQTFTLAVNNSHYKVVDSSGSDIGVLTIEASQTKEFDFYIKKQEDAIFTSETETTNVVLISEGQRNSNCGKITLLVDYIEEYIDTTPPQITNVNATIENEIGTILLTWNGIDDVSIKNYTILIYSENELIKTLTTNSDETSITISNLSEGTYYFKIYATDQSGNTATQQDIENAKTESGICIKTKEETYKWIFNVTTNFTNMKSTGATTVNLGQSYTATLSTTNWFQSLPNQITVTMKGKTLINNVDYTYNNRTGALKINNVDGDITIQGEATGGGICLVEGTKIKLADNKEKNIEDITYNDLLSVWSYDTGNTTYEYPIWIEKTNKIQTYRLIKFEDGTELKTVGHHGIFNVELNKFVTVDNKEEFKIGDHVYKVENNKLKKIKITDIKIINEKVNYYHIISNRYYNIIANNLITTDGTVELSNLYGFDKNITWTKKRQENIENNNLYKYEDFKEIPYYLFKGLRIEEAKYLKTMTKEDFMKYAKENIINNNMLKEIKKNKNGKRMFMVTTDITQKGKKYLKEEGTKYKIPIDEKVKCYLNTTDNKCYNGGEIIEITTPTHFIKKYK